MTATVTGAPFDGFQSYACPGCLSMDITDHNTENTNSAARKMSNAVNSHQQFLNPRRHNLRRRSVAAVGKEIGVL